MSLIKLFFGKTGSGKSYKAQSLLKGRTKVIVYDYAHCFSGGVVTDDFSTKNFASILSRVGGPKNKSKKFKYIFRKPPNMIHEEAVTKLAHFVLHLGRSYGYRSLPEHDLIVFLVDEADKCTTKKSDDKVRLAVQAGRHENISTWAIAQRPMRLHPDFRDNVSEIFAFKCGNNPFYKELFGRGAVEQLERAPQYSFIHWTDTGTLNLINKQGRKKDVSSF